VKTTTVDFTLTLSLVFCCYEQVYDIYNMSCLGVILQVRGRDGISTPQNGVAAYSQYHIFARVVYRCLKLIYQMCLHCNYYYFCCCCYVQLLINIWSWERTFVDNSTRFLQD